MKKILLGATALSMMGVAGGVAAQEWSSTVGGSMVVGIGAVDAERAETNAVVVNNSEVTFNFRLVADNGLTFSVKGELENNGADNNMDEYVGRVAGSFGTIEIGAEDGAMDRLFGGPAGATAFTAAGDATGLLFDYQDGEVGYGIDTDGEESSDDLKITYFTPSFSGFQAGVSFIPTDQEGPTHTSIQREDQGMVEVGAEYEGDFGGFTVGVGAGASFAEDDRDFESSYGGSLNVGFGGFSIGGSIGFIDVDIDTGTPTTSIDDDYLAYAIGANYATGPWLFGLQFAQTLDAPSSSVNGTSLRGAEADFNDQFGVSAGIDYALAPGVTVGATLEYLDAGDNTFTDDDGDITDFDDAYAAGIFMNLDY